MTNGDKIRSMTDEELAQFLANNNFGCPCQTDCPSDGDDFCDECWLYWLKKEG